MRPPFCVRLWAMYACVQLCVSLVYQRLSVYFTQELLLVRDDGSAVPDFVASSIQALLRVFDVFYRSERFYYKRHLRDVGHGRGHWHSHSHGGSRGH